MVLCQGHNTPFGHEQQFCELLSRFNKTVDSYHPGTDFPYVCIMALTLGIWLWVKDNCLKYWYPSYDLDKNYRDATLIYDCVSR